MSELVEGRRVYQEPDGNYLRLTPGDYGFCPVRNHWVAMPPGEREDEVRLNANLSAHAVEEHENGTITVSPSILITAHRNDCQLQWHGYLEKGMWREV